MSEDSPSLEILRGPSGVRPATGNVVSWELARLRQLMPGLVSRAMAYSAMPQFDQPLVDAVKFYYGLEMDVSAAESEILADDDERIRFFPWLLWDWRTGETSKTIGEQFRDEDLHSEFERRLLSGLCESHIGFYEALSDATQQGVELRHLLTGRSVTLKDEGLEGELSQGQLLQCRLVEVTCANGNIEVLIDAVYAVLPAEAQERIERELQSLPGASTGEIAAMERFAPELLEVAEQILDGLALPEHSEFDLSASLVLMECRLKGDTAAAVVTALRARPSDFVEVSPGQWRYLVDGVIAGFVLLCQGQVIRCGAARPEAFYSLRERLTDLASVQIGGLCSVTDFGVAVEGWVSNGAGRSWLTLLPEVLNATRQWLSLFSQSNLTESADGVDDVLDSLSRLRQS